MTKLPEACVEAAKVDIDKSILVCPSPETRARCVILALAKELPESAVDAAKATGIYASSEEARAAIIAALEDVGGGR